MEKKEQNKNKSSKIMKIIIALIVILIIISAIVPISIRAIKMKEDELAAKANVDPEIVGSFKYETNGSIYTFKRTGTRKC